MVFCPCHRCSLSPVAILCRGPVIREDQMRLHIVCFLEMWSVTVTVTTLIGVLQLFCQLGRLERNHFVTNQH
jgi:hypothetical protein